MSPETVRQRLLTAFELHEAGVQMKRLHLRRTHSEWSEDRVDEALRAWLQDRPGAEDGDVGGDVATRSHPT